MTTAKTAWPTDAVQWVVRQTGFGQRSWAYDSSKVHLLRTPYKTRCGHIVPGQSKIVTPGPHDAPCRRCFR